MRLATGSALLYRAVAEWPDHASDLSVARSISEGLSALFLFVGFGTPFWGAATAVMQLWCAYSHSEELLTHALLATLGVSLALLGAGASSIDARIFGWRRIDVAKARRDPHRLGP